LARSETGPDCDHTCILTIQADRPGGVPVLVDWWVTFLTGWGHRATVLYATFREYGIDYWERLRLTIRTWRVHPRPEHPHPTLANAPLPVPLWLFYFVPQWLLGPLLDRFDQIVVATGSPHVALPLALRGRPFVLWMATLYEDELRGKALVGDAWAARVLRSPFWPFLVWQERFVLRRASRILSISPYTRRRILETLPGVADKLDLVMTPVDVEALAPLPFDERKPQARYILTVGRVNDPRKNIPMLLHAFASIHARRRDLRLVLVGDDPGEPLLALTRQLRLENAVEFRGKVPERELHRLYQEAELFVLASTQEGLGIVMLEAMACGLPVVATDCGGPEGIVISGETGRLVPNNDAGALAQAVMDLLNAPEQLAAMRERCVAFVREHCARPIVERQLYEHFVSVFPESEAARKKLFDAPDAGQTVGLSPLSGGRPIGMVRAALAALWAVFVFAVYMQRQMAILWPAIRDKLLLPLLGAFR
jgi:glycosyltransferase involved in cell wall biosynthesis